MSYLDSRPAHRSPAASHRIIPVPTPLDAAFSRRCNLYTSRPKDVANRGMPGVAGRLHYIGLVCCNKQPYQQHIQLVNLTLRANGFLLLPPPHDQRLNARSAERVYLVCKFMKHGALLAAPRGRDPSGRSRTKKTAYSVGHTKQHETVILLAVWVGLAWQFCRPLVHR
ncbi:hypothetical protein K438DRAFT_295303 [Mycena galopus ATCC 62051]|nr:hypothetical protein K438DRAFT_295303 [Mycena galopus ATCC 62051]